MTSEQIQNADKPYEHDQSFWLKEIAYQLAVMNERAAQKSLDDAEIELILNTARQANPPKPPTPLPKIPSRRRAWCTHNPEGPEECGRCYRQRTFGESRNV